MISSRPPREPVDGLKGKVRQTGSAAEVRHVTVNQRPISTARNRANKPRLSVSEEPIKRRTGAFLTDNLVSSLSSLSFKLFEAGIDFELPSPGIQSFRSQPACGSTFFDGPADVLKSKISFQILTSRWKQLTSNKSFESKS